MNFVLRRGCVKHRERNLFRLAHDYSHCPQPITIQRTFHILAPPPSDGPAATHSSMTQMMRGARQKLSQAMDLLAQSAAGHAAPESNCAPHSMAHSKHT